MKTPKNLVDAVNRIRPRAILLLDTNIIMNDPRIDCYAVREPGPYILVVTQMVERELKGLSRGGSKKEDIQKATRALASLHNLYALSDPSTGIDLGSGRWLVKVSVPARADTATRADRLILKKLRRVDAALIRLVETFEQDCPNTATVLITEDQLLTLIAILKGRSVLTYSDLQSHEVLERTLGEASPSKAQEVDISDLLNPAEERLVNIAFTLEELRCDGDYSIARGSGRLIDGDTRYPFRWTFPFEDFARYKNLWEIDIHELNDNIVMPVENVDFMGEHEKLTEPLKRLVCYKLEESGGWSSSVPSLQNPNTIFRFNLVWHTAMAMLKGVPFGPRAEVHKQNLAEEEVKRYDKLSSRHDQLMQCLVVGSARDFASEYRSVLQLNEEIEKLLGWEEEYDPEFGPWDLESALSELLNISLGTWSVGETHTIEEAYIPFELPEVTDERFFEGR